MLSVGACLKHSQHPHIAKLTFNNSDCSTQKSASLSTPPSPSYLAKKTPMSVQCWKTNHILEPLFKIAKSGNACLLTCEWTKTSWYNQIKK